MALLDNPELRRALARVVSGMLNYMDSGETSYSDEDVENCREILVAHATALEQLENRVAALDLVKSTVKRLNKLNEEAGQELIETDQREEICGFLIKAGALMGFNSEDEDVAEPWREW